MPLWTDDPELLSTFRAEVDERLASLSSGLLQLEGAPRSREVMQAQQSILAIARRMEAAGQIILKLEQGDSLMV